MDNMSDVLDRLAVDIAEQLKGENVTLQTKLEAFKILSAREANMARRKPKADEQPDDDDDEDPRDVPSFDAMRRQIRKVS